MRNMLFMLRKQKIQIHKCTEIITYSKLRTEIGHELLVLDDFGFFIYYHGTESKQAIWCLHVLRLILNL